MHISLYVNSKYIMGILWHVLYCMLIVILHSKACEILRFKSIVVKKL